MKRLILLVVLLLTVGSARAQGALADRIEDLRRTATVRAALALDAQTRAYDVAVTTQDGVVTLTGEVGSLGVRERAEALARDVRGVRAVQNGLRVEGRPDLPVTRAEPASAAYEDEEQRRETEAPEPAPEAEAPAPQAVYHTVRSGDTLYSIARRYGTTVQALQRLNDLRGTDIRLGQRLRVR